ncbi:MAG: hypothetical protein A2X94_02820 [Bdellovibrionales bacterium GWB1_55_8]|nr:MAG: hypothetical protein A2X94_02820 [Bdellovibrionales bacterium GWB1_55_8]
MLKNLIDRLESKDVPFFWSVLTFVFAVTIRNFVELFNTHERIDLFGIATLVHYSLFYGALALALAVLLRRATALPIERVLRVVLPSFVIVITAPLFDLLISGGSGFPMGYFGPEFHDRMFLRFLTFFGTGIPPAQHAPIPTMGITPGIRIEVAFVLAGLTYYLRIKGASWLRTVFSVFAGYSLIFAFVSAPFFLMGFSRLIGIYPPGDWSPTYALAYALLIAILGGVLVCIWNRAFFLALARDFRWERLLHFELMFVLGIVMKPDQARSALEAPTLETLLAYWVAGVALAFAWLFSVMTNNLVDSGIDAIANPGRPIPAGAIPPDRYKSTSWIVLGLAVSYAALAGFYPLFMILLFVGGYFLYSMPPLRLKTVPFFSKVIIAFNSLTLVIFGFVSHSPDLELFPKPLIVFFLVGMTAAIQFIDLKDYEGDRAEGIRTLPVLLGLRRSQFVIGVFVALGYFGITTRIPDKTTSALFVLVGLVQFLLIIRKKYTEKPVFLLYLASLVYFIHTVWSQSAK